MQFRPYPVMTACVMASLVVLIWLGSWQWSRYQDKLSQREIPPIETSRVSVTVIAGDVGAQSLYAIIDGEPVWRRYVPATIDGGEGRVVLALWDGIGGVEPLPLSLEGLGSVTRESAVFIRETRVSGFAAKNRPEDDTWHSFDGPAMLARLGFPGRTYVQVVEPVELTIYAGADVSRFRTTANPYASPKPLDPLPPARHLGYALTWWGLALGLIAFYLGFHVSNGRLSLGGKR